MKLNKKAILFGATLDLGLSAFFSKILYAIIGYWLVAKGVPASEVVETANSYNLFYYLLLAWVLTLIFWAVIQPQKLQTKTILFTVLLHQSQF
jgi:hypothetical protein